MKLLAVSILVAVAGPWLPAQADDWPGPVGDPFAGHGVIAADVSMTSNGAVGFRVTLPTPGEIDLVGWIDGDTPNGDPDDELAIGGYMWSTTKPSIAKFTAITEGTGHDVRVDAEGAHVVDQRGAFGQKALGLGSGYTTSEPGTYLLVMWAATSSPSATTRFRVHIPSDATLVDQTSTSSGFLRTLRQFSGTAGATVDEYPAAASVAVGESTSAEVNDRLFGLMLAGTQNQHSVPVGSYTGPDGSHPMYGQEWLDNGPGGAYTFTFDHSEYVNAGGLQPFVAGADLVAP